MAQTLFITPFFKVSVPFFQKERAFHDEVKQGEIRMFDVKKSIEKTNVFNQVERDGFIFDYLENAIYAERKLLSASDMSANEMSKCIDAANTLLKAKYTEENKKRIDAEFKKQNADMAEEDRAVSNAVIDGWKKEPYEPFTVSSFKMNQVTAIIQQQHEINEYRNYTAKLQQTSKEGNAELRDKILDVLFDDIYQVEDAEYTKKVFRHYLTNAKRSAFNEADREYQQILFIVGDKQGIGKSTLAEFIAEAIDKKQVTPLTFSDITGNFTPEDIANLPSLWVDEIGTIDTEKSDMLKALITAENVRVNKKYQQPKVLYKRAQIICSSNYPADNVFYNDTNSRRRAEIHMIDRKKNVPLAKLRELINTLYEATPYEYTYDVEELNDAVMYRQNNDTIFEYWKESEEAVQIVKKNIRSSKLRLYKSIFGERGSKAITVKKFGVYLQSKKDYFIENYSSCNRSYSYNFTEKFISMFNDDNPTPTNPTDDKTHMNGQTDADIDDLEALLNSGDTAESAVESNAFYTNQYQHLNETKQQPDATTQFETLNPVNRAAEKRSDETAASKRNLVFEMDNMSLQEQVSLVKPYKDSNKLINRIVFSGHKSLHCRVCLKKEPESIEHYKYIWHRINEEYFNFAADKASANLSRLTRCPNAIRIESNGAAGRVQKLLYKNDTVFFDAAVYAADWEKEKEERKQNEEKNRLLADMSKDSGRGKIPYDRLATDEARCILDDICEKGERNETLSKGIPNLLSAGYSEEEIIEHINTISDISRRKSSLEFAKWIFNKNNER